MAQDDGNLLSEVQRDALDSKVALADTLRKLVAFGGIVGSMELREWAALELHGYLGEDVPLPRYRKPGAVLLINGFAGARQITGQQIGPHSLPDAAHGKIGEEVMLGAAVGEVEAMLVQAKEDGGEIKLTIPHGQTLAAMMNQESDNPFQKITAIYWSLSAPAIAGVLDQIRSTLVELVAEMRANTPASEDVPTGEAADRAVSVVIYGGNPSVNVSAALASGSGAHQVNAESTLISAPKVEAAWPGLRDELVDLGVPDGELNDLHRALVADGDPDGELGNATNSWIGRLSSRIASGAIMLGNAASVEVISHTILKALGLG